MIERTYTYKITVKSIFEPWVIKTYLHKRTYNILYVLTKALPVLLFALGGFDSTFQTVYNIGLFFFFDIYMLIQYLRIKSKVQRIYGNDNLATVFLKENEIIFSSKDRESILSWDGITRVKETRWFFLFYKDKYVIATIYKRIMPKEDLESVIEYFKEQSNLNRYISFRK